jgi:hypothetical protein
MEGRGMHAGFWWVNLQEQDHLADTGIGDRKRIILKWILKKYKAVDWIHLAHDRHNW